MAFSSTKTLMLRKAWPNPTVEETRRDKAASHPSLPRWALAPQNIRRVLGHQPGFFGQGAGNPSACPRQRARPNHGRLGRGGEVVALSVGALAAWRFGSGQSAALSVSHTSGKFLRIPRPTSHSTGRRCSRLGSSAALRPGAGEFPRYASQAIMRGRNL